MTNVPSGLKRVVATRLPTRCGAFRVLAYECEIGHGGRRVQTALAMMLGELSGAAPNPLKFRALIDAGIEIAERVPCEADPNPHSRAYLRTKRERMGHALARAA